MFAPKVAKPQIKAAESSTSRARAFGGFRATVWRMGERGSGRP